MKQPKTTEVDPRQLQLDLLPQWKVILRDKDGKATTTVEGHYHEDAVSTTRTLFPEATTILTLIK